MKIQTGPGACVDAGSDTELHRGGIEADGGRQESAVEASPPAASRHPLEDEHYVLIHLCS